MGKQGQEVEEMASSGLDGSVRVSRWPGVLLVLILLVALAFVVAQLVRNLRVDEGVAVGRSVADLAENIGRWASKYGGVHVRTQGADAALPGNFLTRSMYAGSSEDAHALGGSRVTESSPVSEREAMARLEAYHWKNPALVQREVADVIGESGSRVRYRMTARSVLNPNNAPNNFELEAMGAIEQAFARANVPADAKPGSVAEGVREYWVVRDNRLNYARAVIAQASCLKCHDTLEKAPEFLRTNTQFNGGGGFGYVAGRPIGVISVSVPLSDPLETLGRGLDLAGIAAALTAALAALLLAVWVVRRGLR